MAQANHEFHGCSQPSPAGARDRRGREAGSSTFERDKSGHGHGGETRQIAPSAARVADSRPRAIAAEGAAYLASRYLIEVMIFRAARELGVAEQDITAETLIGNAAAREARRLVIHAARRRGIPTPHIARAFLETPRYVRDSLKKRLRSCDDALVARVAQ